MSAEATLAKQKRSSGLPDEWARRAASRPLAFSQVREDPRLDLELLRENPSAARVVMIASGGETAACLGRLPLQQLVLVDMNAAQLALTRLKWHLAEHFAPSESMALLGHRPMNTALRSQSLRRILHHLQLNEQVFGPEALLHGPDQAGRYEILFAELRRVLAPQRNLIRAMLRQFSTFEAAVVAAPSAPLGKALDAALARVMSLPNLVCLFGETATQNPAQPFHRHFAQRLRHALRTFRGAENPFLWQMIGGGFPKDRPYDWLRSRGPLLAKPTFLHRQMREALDSLPARSMTSVHLSNILDWLSPQEAAASLRSAARVLQPKGRVIIRQLNSSLDIPALADKQFSWDRALSRRLTARDRSFFYTAVHVGRKS